MRILCNKCGKPVSTEVPEGTIIRAWVECPECVEKSPEDVREAMQESFDKWNGN